MIDRRTRKARSAGPPGSAGVSPAPGSAGVPPAPGSAGVPPAKGWYSRGYLPHCDAENTIQAIAFRLHDALPRAVIARLAQAEFDQAERRRRIEALLDAGHGACWLQQPPIARQMQDTLLHFDGQRYHLLAWCVMPNHVHTLVEILPPWTLSQIAHSWKSYSAKNINRVLERKGTVWQREYYDRYIRDDGHLAAAIAYVHANPVKAGLVGDESAWPYSSAGAGARGP